MMYSDLRTSRAFQIVSDERCTEHFLVGLQPWTQSDPTTLQFAQNPPFMCGIVWKNLKNTTPYISFMSISKLFNFLGMAGLLQFLFGTQTILVDAADPNVERSHRLHPKALRCHVGPGRHGTGAGNLWDQEEESRGAETAKMWSKAEDEGLHHLLSGWSLSLSLSLSLCLYIIYIHVLHAQ